MNKKSYTSPRDAERIDQHLAQTGICTSRSEALRLIQESRVWVNDKIIKPSDRVFLGDKITINWPPLKSLELTPKKIFFEILYEDKDILVINKPAGLVVHPGAGNYDESLVHGLLHHCGDLSGIGGVERPGIVHRLDKGTSGAMVVAKNDKAHQNLSLQFQNKEVKKEYVALCLGGIEKQEQTLIHLMKRSEMNRKKFVVNQKKGKQAITHVKVLKKNSKVSYISVKIETGRTHQIRVHLNFIGHPILGDETYGGTKKLRGLSLEEVRHVQTLGHPLLHSKNLEFKHPRSAEKMSFFCDLPEDFKNTLKYFFE